jgi:hypothetical protein
MAEQATGLDVRGFEARLARAEGDAVALAVLARDLLLAVTDLSEEAARLRGMLSPQAASCGCGESLDEYRECTDSTCPTVAGCGA